MSSNHSRRGGAAGKTGNRILAAGGILAGLGAGQGLNAAPHRYDHVVIVIEENKTSEQIIGDVASAPYINSLVENGVFLTRMFALQHPSQPNYLHLFAGSDQGVKGDSRPWNFSTTPTATYPFTTPNLGASLISAGFTFGSYSESLEMAGGQDYADYDPQSGADPITYYRRKHNPVTNWVGKISPLPPNQLPPAVNMPFSLFPADFSQLPTLSLVVPNQLNDMHDGTRVMGDDWLKTHLDAYAQWAKSHNSLLIITWDEDNRITGNRIPTIFYGAALRDGTAAAGTWTLHNLLRTLEDMYGLGVHAGSAAQVGPITGLFSEDAPVSVLNLQQGLNGYSGVRDTVLTQEIPAASNAAAVDLAVDRGAAAVREVLALVRFESLFGDGPNLVPVNAVLRSAKLVVSTPANAGTSGYDSNSRIELHRMIRDWADTDNWGSLTDGVSADGTEAEAEAAFTLIPSEADAPAIFDVTADLKLFQSGAAANRGWLLRASAADAADLWTFKSSEAPDAGLRPALEIVYSPASATPSPYSVWAAANGLSRAGAMADPDHDGAVNLIEFSFNLNPLVPDSLPAQPDGAGGLPFLRAVDGPEGMTLEITFLRRKGPGAMGLEYTAGFSPDLRTWSAGQTSAADSVDADWDRVTVRKSGAGISGARYARVKVGLTQ
ncbi:MAG: putative Acid phosphatase [Verrucomicrobiales bacterium]|nr:putative Acid phosphatase [Verrucomicrobiales bacterium]